MAQLVADRKFIERGYGDRNFPVAAAARIWENGMVQLGASDGLARLAGATGTSANDVCVGCSKFRADNVDGGNSAISVEVKSDTVRPMFNSGGADTITLADVGKDCYVVDGQTVALTSNTGARGRAGRIHDVTELGVWVRFDR